jgi:hypothetical protein
VRFSRLLPQVWVRLAVVTSRCSRIPSSDDGLIAVCSAGRDECTVGQPMAARLLLTQPGRPIDCTCRRNWALSARWSGNPAAICIPQNADLLSYSKICVSCRISPALNHIVLGRV